MTSVETTVGQSSIVEEIGEVGRAVLDEGKYAKCFQYTKGSKEEFDTIHQLPHSRQRRLCIVIGRSLFSHHLEMLVPLEKYILDMHFA